MSEVMKVKATDNLENDIQNIVESLGGWGKFVSQGERVFIKPNFNTADDPPASTDMNFLKAFVNLLEKQRPGEIMVGESCTYFHCTEEVMTMKKARELEEETSAKVLNLDEEPWEKKKVSQGKYLKGVKVPEILKEVDRIMFLSCLKTHIYAEYTGALKLSVGLMHSDQRIPLHLRRLQEKIAELNLLFNPDLVLMDARKCFINKGPAEGEIEEPGLVLGSPSRVEIDKQGVNILNRFERSSLKGKNPEDILQIRRAIELGVDSKKIEGENSF